MRLIPVLLVAPVVLLAGCTYTGQPQSTDRADDQRQDVEEQLRTSVDLVSIACHADDDRIQFFMKNRGQTAVDASPVTVNLYAVDAGTQLASGTRSIGTVGPGDVVRDNVTADTDITGGTVYRLELAFPDAGGYSTSGRCQAQ